MSTHATSRDPKRAEALRRSTRRTGWALAALAAFFVISVGVAKLWGKL